MVYSGPTFTEPSFPHFDNNLLASATMATCNGKKPERYVFLFFTKSVAKAAPLAEESEVDRSVEREEEEKKAKKHQSDVEKRDADRIKSGEKGPKKKKKIKGSSLVAFGGHVVGFKRQYPNKL